MSFSSLTKQIEAAGCDLDTISDRATELGLDEEPIKSALLELTSCIADMQSAISDADAEEEEDEDIEEDEDEADEDDEDEVVR